MTTVSAIFGDANEALLAGEAACEAASDRAAVRMLLPGRGDSMLEVAVVPDSRGGGRVALLGAIVGIAGMILFKAAGVTWPVALVGLFAGVVGGALLALWLSGELFPSRLLAGPDARRLHEALLRSGQ